MKNVILAKDHEGIRISYSGLLMQSRNSCRDKALAEMLRQLELHMTELGKRWYAGDQTVVDEFLQLYCIAENDREAVKQAANGAKP